MYTAMSCFFFFLGIIFAIAGKPFLEVAACFFIFMLSEGVYELHKLREELECWEDDDV